MKAQRRTLNLPPSWPTVVIVVVVVLFLVRPDLGSDQIRTVENIVYLLAGGGVAAASGVRHGRLASEQGQ